MKDRFECIMAMGQSSPFPREPLTIMKFPNTRLTIANNFPGMLVGDKDKGKGIQESDTMDKRLGRPHLPPIFIF